MWALDNQTPFAAERGWVRDRDGAEIWLVAVKASFLLLDDGTTQLAEVQEPVHLAPEFHVIHSLAPDARGPAMALTAPRACIIEHASRARQTDPIRGFGLANRRYRRSGGRTAPIPTIRFHSVEMRTRLGFLSRV